MRKRDRSIGSEIEGMKSIQLSTWLANVEGGVDTAGFSEAVSPSCVATEDAMRVASKSVGSKQTNVPVSSTQDSGGMTGSGVIWWAEVGADAGGEIWAEAGDGGSEGEMGLGARGGGGVDGREREEWVDSFSIVTGSLTDSMFFSLHSMGWPEMYRRDN